MRRSTPSDALAKGPEARRGAVDPPERIMQRAVTRYASMVLTGRHRFFICAGCGKLAGRGRTDVRRQFGLGCYREAQHSEEWGQFALKRRQGILAEAPWAGKRSKRYPDTLRLDLALLLEFSALGRTIPELAKAHSLSEDGVKKALARCREVLPSKWSHLFPKARGVMRTADLVLPR